MDTNVLRNADYESNIEDMSVWDEIRQLHLALVLNYSATHNEIINPKYKLDSYAAYKDNLVKKIYMEIDAMRKAKRTYL